MKRSGFIFLLIATVVKLSFSQVSINSDNSLPDPSAGLDIKFTNKGLLPPRMTQAELIAITNPANGLLAFCTDCGINGTSALVIAMAGAWHKLNSTCLSPFAPASGSHIATNTSIQWTWAAVPNASGYRWNTVNNYQTATDLGSSLSHMQSGLNCGTPYTSYVWTYSACGVSAPVTLSKSTVQCTPVCGTSFTVNHIAGSVAPVTKTTSYQLVTNVPGLPSKCWIASNLGATYQAAYVGDPSEESAGWYWQFNRKQGFKHDGSVRTPNTTWSANISENADWTVSEDPCTLELGAVWRLPTYTEWFNVSQAGGWTNWSAPFSSPLKLHAAGLLYYTNGSLSSRGNYTMIWTGTQYNTDQANHLQYYQYDGGIYPDRKAFAYPVRCLY